jgi:integrase/recombinase XerD
MSADSSPLTQINSQTQLKPAINAWKIFLDDQGRSIHTIKAFVADMNLLRSYMPPDRVLGAITTGDLNNFLDWMQNERGVPCSPKTLARRITSLKSFFRWLQKNGVILVDPAEKVVQKSVISPLPTVLNPDELDAVLHVAHSHRFDEAPDARPYAMLKLLIDSAIKKGECLSLTENHLDLKAANGPILFVRYASPQHRYKERKIALSYEWIEAFQEYRQQYDLSEKLFPWSPRRLEYLLEDIGKEAGLEKQLSFLMCRWTSALVDYTDGVDPNKIRQKLGISKIQWREVLMKLRKLATEDLSEDS